MKKGNLIFIAGGLYLLYYYFSRNKSSSILQINKSNEMPSVTTTTAPIFVPKVYTYSGGLQENDYVKGTFYEEVYALKNGEKRPVTRNFWLKYYGDNYGNVKVVDQVLLIDIPTGSVLDA